MYICSLQCNTSDKRNDQTPKSKMKKEMHKVRERDGDLEDGMSDMCKLCMQTCANMVYKPVYITNSNSYWQYRKASET